MIKIKCGGIYLLTHKSGYFYVGKSNSIYDRWSSHYTGLKLRTHHCDKLQELFNNSKIEDWTFKVLFHLEKTHLRNESKLKGKELDKLYNKILGQLEKQFMSKYSREFALNTQNKEFK